MSMHWHSFTFEAQIYTMRRFQGDALSPTTYAGSLSGARMVVSTIGTLLEDDRYKRVLR